MQKIVFCAGNYWIIYTLAVNSEWERTKMVQNAFQNVMFNVCHLTKSKESKRLDWGLLSVVFDVERIRIRNKIDNETMNDTFLDSKIERKYLPNDWHNWISALWFELVWDSHCRRRCRRLLSITGKTRKSISHETKMFVIGNQMNPKSNGLLKSSFWANIESN